MNSKILIVDTVVGSIVIFDVMVVTLLVLLKRRRKKGLEKKYGFVLVLNLQDFTYRELQLARFLGGRKKGFDC